MTKQINNVLNDNVLNNNFSYTQVASAFVPQKDFDSFIRPFSAFYFFLFQKDFDIFHVLLLVVFICHFLYIENIIKYIFIYTKNYKNILLVSL